MRTAAVESPSLSTTSGAAVKTEDVSFGNKPTDKGSPWTFVAIIELVIILALGIGLIAVANGNSDDGSSPSALAASASACSSSGSAAAVAATVEGCVTTIVGAGAGGFYTAYRLIFDAGVPGGQICIFEADVRTGGRIYSVRGQGDHSDLVVDAGGYRTFDTISPRTQYLITDRLNLTLDCYDPVSCLGKVVVNAEGHRIGYETFVDRIHELVVAAGVRVMLERPLTRIEKLGTSASPSTRLTFSTADGGTVSTTSNRVVLTLPQYPLQQVVRNSPGLGMSDALLSSVHAVQPVYAVKLYLYYEDAWWVTKYGLREGSFTSDGNAVSPPLQGRYHDGDIRCTDATQTSCYGFLQTQYFWDFSGRTQNYFARFQQNRSSVVTHLSQTVDGHIALADVHAEVMAFHNLTAADNIPAPTEGVLVTYNMASPWANTGWHYWTDASQLPTLEAFLSADNIHLINEAYSPAPSWAEGAIVLADNMIESLYGIPPPHSPVQYRARNYASEVWADAPHSVGSAPICENTCMRNGASLASFANNGGCNDGAEGSTLTSICDYGTDCADCGPRSASGGGGDAGFADDPACFMPDSKLLLANGSRIELAAAQVGMRVSSALGKGTITVVLVHPIGKKVKRFRVPTTHGDLVGTLSHPVHVNGTWLEASDAAALGLLPGLVTEIAHVVEYYNLEIDGDRPGASAHAYELNGHVVSGLGDSEVLNKRYPRQMVYKDAPAA